MILQIDS